MRDPESGNDPNPTTTDQGHGPMPHETKLIALIAVCFSFAMVFGFLAARLRLPPLLGYLLAGIAVGPFTPGFVADAALAAQLAEIGVILLMFGVGLHFSLDTLKQVRKIALPGAIAQIVVATSIGASLAWWWGWGLAAGLVFGLAMSVASTVVLLRALEQRNELDTHDGRIAVGWLVVEDLAMVLALVFLPVLADATRGAAVDVGEIAGSVAVTALKVAMFFFVMLVVGRRVVPWLLGQIANTGSRELFTLAVLTLAVGIAYGSAALFDVSFALGAFFAGVVLAESDLSHQAAENSLPFRDAFAVLFFVSVGMLFDPSVVIERPAALLGVLFVILVGKTLAAFFIVMAFGYAPRTALTISASLAQIGEFSFILVGLGVGLGLLPPQGRDLILAGALLSITLNPFAFSTVTRWRAGWKITHACSACWRSAGDASNRCLPVPGQLTCAITRSSLAMGAWAAWWATRWPHRGWSSSRSKPITVWSNCCEDKRSRWCSATQLHAVCSMRRASTKPGCSSSRHRMVFIPGVSSNWHAPAIPTSRWSCARTAPQN